MDDGIMLAIIITNDIADANFAGENNPSTFL